MADNITLPGTGEVISAEEITTLNGGAVSAQKVERVAIASRTADGTAIDLPGTTAEGLDVDVTRVPADPFGANADAIVAAGAVGSIQAKLRRITQGLEDLKTLVVLGAGTNKIGKVVNAPGEAQTWLMQSTFQALAANKLYFDLFNAVGSGKIIRVHWIAFQKNMAAVAGIALQFDLQRTTAVGTGGSVLTPVALDTDNTVLPAGITARHAATGGATLGSLLMSRFYHAEETNIAAQAQEAFPLWPPATLPGITSQDIVLREGQGLTLKQITSSTAGTYNAIVCFSVE